MVGAPELLVAFNELFGSLPDLDLEALTVLLFAPDPAPVREPCSRCEQRADEDVAEVRPPGLPGRRRDSQRQCQADLVPNTIAVGRLDVQHVVAVRQTREVDPPAIAE